MRNVVFVSLNGNVIEISNKLFHKNNFFLKYLNKFCGYFVPKDDKRINVWLTVGLYSKYNLMVYDRMDKAFIVVCEPSMDGEFWNNLKKNYEQLKKVSKNISMISLDIKKIEQKKSLLMWCIEHDNMQFIELKEQDGICLNNL
jgi:hypothetical protein